MAERTGPCMSGVDVSQVQDGIDWQQVRRGCVVFAFIKAGEGEKINDPRFGQNWVNAKRAGILRGACHYFHPGMDPIEQARFFLSKLNSDQGELPPVLVLEGEALRESSDEKLIAGARTWLQFVEQQLKHKPILQTHVAFWRNLSENPEDLSGYPLSIAHHTIAARPLIPTAWTKWTFWQFSQQGKVRGIPSQVNLVVFNGSAIDLEAFCIRKVSLPKLRVAV